MSKWLFISTTDVCDADDRISNFEIDDEETYNKVKKIYDKLLPIVWEDHAFEKVISDIKENQTDLEGNSLDDDMFDEYMDFLSELFVLCDGDYDNDAHTLRDMKLYQVIE